MTKYADNAFALVNVEQHSDIDIYRSATRVGVPINKGICLFIILFLYSLSTFLLIINQLAMDETFEHSSKKLVGLINADIVSFSDL